METQVDTLGSESPEYHMTPWALVIMTHCTSRGPLQHQGIHLVGGQVLSEYRSPDTERVEGTLYQHSSLLGRFSTI